ncbi:amino acid adenylation domain-containing protein [Kibdelosporangium philippinense]|uniref:Phenyloxazoline synthase MbtB n=1 Tax=Kibdelosporangium philippinense TaxID=211113 RepID=A0ABS8ZS74_9PSEU|nr:non-ribosomal peptide synthetase [Kibdelosporangium philippinense]MCE7009273.1 amino acid adenylation domain-containing protein [Kibdelosporangium philippinense]
MSVDCVIIGQGTVAVLCAEQLLANGVVIKAVVSTEPILTGWAAERGIQSSPGLKTLPDKAFDYLFSIVNPVILTPDELALPRRLAINFHDGPLPRYAGVHATSWALIDGVRRHAITWHVMTEAADEGPIVTQRWFDVDPDETAFSLNAKCYSEAVAAFTELLPRLLAGDVVLAEQDLACRTYFGRHDRPDGLLDFAKPAESIRGLVAALDFAPYPNPLTTAKVWTGTHAVAVESIQVTSLASEHPPGTVVATAGGFQQVATGTNDVLLRLADSAVVDRFPEFPEHRRVRLNELIGQTARLESWWLRRFRQVVAAQLHANINTSRAALPTVMAFLSRVNHGPFDVALVDPDTVDAYPAEFFAHAVPWRSPVDPTGTLADARHAVDDSLAGLAGTYPRDLLARYSIDADLPVTVTIWDGPVVFDDPDLAARYEIFCRGSAGPIADIPLVDDAERDVLLTAGKADQDSVRACVHNLFEQVAANSPDAVAVRMAEQSLTYGELDRRANQVAHCLVGKGIRTDDVVGLRMERSIDLLVGLLGILKSGAAYLPLDPRLPDRRLAFMAADAQAHLVMDTIDAGGFPDTDPDIEARPDSLAYVIYTSGTTGKPKGCAVEHQHLATTLVGAQREFGFGAMDVLPSLASPAFDISLLELLLPLISGGTTVLVDAEQVTDIVELVEHTSDATFFHAVPSLMSAWLEHAGGHYPALRCLLVGGDAVPRRLLDDLMSHFPTAQVIELYGPTEATIISTFHHVNEGTHRDVPHCIGKRFGYTSTYVLDPSRGLTPAGSPGELWLGGSTIARGYLGNDDLTAQRFAMVGGERLYRTGDLVRYLPDGSMEFLGRTDDQVKIRGFRIELSEIEHALGAQDGVDAAVVIARDTPTGKQLVAYVAADEVPGVPEFLPDYMVPAHIVRLDSLPLNANGKIDRAALPLPEARDGYLPPRTAVERELCLLWQEFLDVPQVGVHDDFFALGGHSLVASRLTVAVRARLRADVTVSTIFKNPTVEALAAHIGPRMTIPRVAERDSYPLSHAQQRIWLHEQHNPGTTTYNIPPVLIRIDGPLDVTRLDNVLKSLVDRHESLRASYHGPTQRVTTNAFQLRHTDDLSIARRFADTPFDLTVSPLRAALVRLEPEAHVLVLSVHHLAADGASFGVLFEELSALYDGRGLDDLVTRYVDYAEWDEGRAFDVSYWTDRLADLPASHGLALDRPRPRLRSHRGALVRRPLPGRDALAALARERGVTQFMILEAAFASLLHRYSGATDIVVGTPVANRENPSTAGLTGCFVNTVVLRTDFTGSPAFDEVLARTAAMATEAFEHQAAPFDMVVAQINPERDPALHPLFQVMFAVEDATAPQLTGVRTSLLDQDHRTAKFDLSLYVRDRGDSLDLMWEYATDIFDAETVAALSDSYETLVAAILAGEPRPSVLSPTQAAAIKASNDTAAPFPEHDCVHELFEAQVERTPHAVAVSFEGREMTFVELNALANQVAHTLTERGIGPDDPVGLQVERGIEMVAGIYGIWKAGAAYVPLEPSYPAARLRQMSAGLAAVLTEKDIAAARGYPDVNPARDASPNDLAYVIFTSGSTGEPKGVMVEHRALVNRIHWMAAEYRLTGSDVVLQKTPFSFDVSVWELTWPLITGARLVILRPDGHKDPDHLVDVIKSDGVTTIHFVPSMLRAMLEHGRWHECVSVRQVFCSGEALPKSVTSAFFATGTDASLHNLYGPTEATIDVSQWTCHAGDQTVPIGHPIQNTTLSVLDEHMRDVPPGAPGELYIGGVGLARGYLHRQDLTSERFVMREGERLYRTGDLVRRRRDGALEFLGRLDHQVKIRGFRVELGEIESVLHAHPDVADAVVVARDELLVAYVVGLRQDLREYLADRLPEYLVPSVFVPLERMPLSANGKVDRNALPDPAFSAPDDTELAGAVEMELAALWQRVLKVRRVGALTNFFHAGGHSLLATRLVAEIRRRWQADISISTVFAHQTLRDLAGVVELATRRDVAPIRPVDRSGPLPVSFGQQRFWLLDQLNPETPQHAVMAAIQLDGELDVPSLERTFRKLIERHEILRTTYHRTDDGVRQDVRQGLGFELPMLDASEADVERLAREEVDKPFDLTREASLRAKVLRLGDQRHVLLLTVHHIASDGWSNGVLYEEITSLYRSETLEPQPVRYADYAVWQRTQLAGAPLAEQIEYWADELADVPVLHGLPLDRPRPAVRSHRGDTVRQVLGQELTAAVRALALDSGSTLFMVLHAGFAALVARYSNADDVVVGTTLANREQAEVSRLVGPFMNPVALRADFRADPTFTELLAENRRRALGAYEHQQVPFEQLLDRLGIERSPAYPPLIQLMLILHNNDGGFFELPGVRGTVLRFEHAQARLDLILDVVERAGELEVSWEYSTDLLDRSTVERMAADFEQLLTVVTAEPEGKVAEIPLVSTVSGSGVVLDYPDKCLHELFEQCADRQPETVAVVDGTRQITYGELNAMANQVANDLIDRGAAADDLVGVHMERSIESVAAFLGILKAGAGYVPISPELPEHRVHAIVADAKPVHVLTGVETGAANHNPGRRVSSSDIAYTIYTSGSTGRPKGVRVEHRAILSSFHAWERAYRLDETRNHLQAAGIGFDVSVGDMVRALCSGGRLVICPKDTLLDPVELHALIEAQDIHFAEFVPLTLTNLVDHLDRAGARLTTLRFLVAGSDRWHGADLGKARNVVAEQTILVNSYGLTEAAVDSTYFESAAGDAIADGPVPIGRPLGNVQAYVLSPAGQPCPIGVPGELYIAGPALARDYLNDPELTEHRFVVRRGVRMYRTGDLAFWRADGQLGLLGRVDLQVKLRGARIELTEIEACLLANETVTAAVATVVDLGGTEILAAYVVATGETDLREYVEGRLPDYMVPAVVTRLDELPMNANGKVDRAALPMPVLGDDSVPDNDTERALVTLWQDLLDVAEPGVRTSFFALGGHSLLAARLVALVRDQWQADIPIRVVFEQPTIRRLARVIDAATAVPSAGIERVDRRSRLALSSAQQRLWLIDQLDQDTTQYTISTALRLMGKLDIAALRCALGDIVERHEILRTTYHSQDGLAYQVVSEPREIDLPVVTEDLDQVAMRVARARFDLTTGPMLRATLVEVAGDHHVLLLSMHHIAADGWSMGILANELTAFYRAAVRGAPNPLPPLEIQYADYAAWDRQRPVGDTEFWLDRLADLPSIHGLPLDHPRPARQSHRGATHVTTVDSAGLRALAEEHGVTLFNVLHAAFACLLSRYADDTDIVVGTPVANRDRAETADLLGFFVNTVVLRTDLAGDPTFAELLRQSRADVMDTLDRQSVPFDVLVDELAPDRSLSHHPLFQIMLVLQNNDQGAFDLPELTASVFKPDGATAKFDLTLDVIEFPGELSLSWEYATDLFEAGTIERMAAHFGRLLSAILAEPGAPISRLSFMDDEEWRQLANWNAMAYEYDQQHLPHEYVSEQPPEAIAVTAYGEQITYGELDRRANRLAHVLIDAGVGPDVVAGILLPRSSIDLIVSVLAVFKAGGAYVALELDAPSARLEHMLRDASIETVLTTSELADRLPGKAIRVDSATVGQASDAPVERRVPQGGLAYLIYTSGSTGTPKALLQTHRTLENLVAMSPITGRMRTLQYAALSFDVSIQEIVTAWRTGSELVLISADDRMDPAAVLDMIAANRIERLFIPTAMLYLVADEYARAARDVTSLREVIVGGETLKITAAVKALIEDNGIVFVNEYGPSETHAVSYEVIEDLTVGSVPSVGHVIGNLRAYVVDRNDQVQPDGLPGELCIGGDGVALGYLNQPELTAVKFVELFGERVYRSGDRVRRLPDGRLEFFGRSDDQIKIRGYRVEIGEIEQVLQRHPAVDDVVVVARQDRQQLVAYVVGAVTGPALHEYLRSRVPDYMIPAIFVPMTALPLTKVGKVDRRRLPQPDFGTADRLAPSTPTEAVLLPIWQDVLGVEQIGVADNFFRLGGHSLLAVRLVNRISQHVGKPVPLRAVLEFPTVARLSAHIDEDSAARPQVDPLWTDPGNAFEPFPLTDIQQAYWLGRGGHFDLGNIGTHSYIEMPAQDLDITRYQRAWNRLIQRHPMLRMVLTPDGRQRILPEVGEYVLRVHDGQDRMKIRERMSHQVFSGYEWPLFEVCVSRESPARSYVHISIDAFSLDAASFLQLFDEWMRLYENPDEPLPPVDITFRDYVLSAQRLRDTEFMVPSRTYWLDRIAEFPMAPNLPFAVDPAEITTPAFEGRRHFTTPEKWAELKQFAARLSITPSVLVIGCFAEVLARWAQSPHFALNLTLFNRIEFHEQVERIVGDFTSLTLLEVDHRQAGATLVDKFAALQRRLFADLEHRHFTGVEVQRELSRRHATTVTYPVVVTSTLGLGNRSGKPGPFDSDGVYTVSQTPQVWLDFQVSEIDGALSCNWDSVSGLFPDGMLDDMFAAFIELLENVPDGQRDTLPAAHRALVAEVNDTAKDFAPSFPARLHQPLLEQIRLRGDKVAVVASGRRVTYRELGLASQRLAARVRPGGLVAILMHKGWQQVVAALAILRAGAAYLPIDASLPAERIRQLLEIGAVEQVLTVEGVACELPTLIVDETLFADGELEFEQPRQAETDLAYVIFTSGSTGTPKGVMIDHRGALNTVLDINDRYAVTEADTVLGLSSMSFDLSVYDVFGVLGAGGTLVLPSPDESRDPQAWLHHLAGERVTLWNTVPALLQMLLDFQPARLDLRLVMLSGDWIPIDLPERLRAVAPDVLLVSLGGATEASIWSIDHVVGDVDPSWRSVPYGKALANQTFYVLKHDLSVAPVYCVGELYIGGIGLARGYWGDPAKTALRFVEHPVTGERLYRTGDLGRLRPDGTIEFLGRDDDQVKVQGHRIELGEIEARLTAHPAVRAAVVSVQDRQLAGYVVPAFDDVSIHGDVLTSEPDRAAFTLQRNGIRNLTGPARSVRALAALGEYAFGKRHYPSAGGLYPVQAYVGGHYYRPDTGELVRVSDMLTDDWTLHLVADMAAIEPMYGRNSEDFCRLEAGYLVQALRSSGVDLTPVPAADIRKACRLTDDHRVLRAYSMHFGDGVPVPARKSYRAFEPANLTEDRLLAVLPTEPELPVVVWIRDKGWFDLTEGALSARDDDRDPAVVFRYSGDVFATAAFAVLLGGPKTPETLHRAGELGQTMMTTAVEGNIGLCPIGVVDTDAVHAFLGGVITDEQIQSADVSQPVVDMAGVLKEFLGQVLPAYMVPPHILRIAEIPLSANGKVNRKALPAPDVPVPDTHVRAETATEKELAGIWQAVLGRPEVGVTDNFFDLGGDSMHAISVVTKARQAGVHFSVRDLYAQQTIAAVAAVASFVEADDDGKLEAFALLSDEQRATIEPEIGLVQDAYPLTKLQQGMIYHSLVDGERGTYHEVVSTHLRLPWDQGKFAGALREITKQHDILRTVLRYDLQLVLTRAEPVLRVHDIRHLDPQAQAAHIRAWIADERASAFEPERPAWSVVIHLRGTDELQYTLVCHHALLDGWSVAKFSEQLLALYRGEPSAGTSSYREFVAAEIAAGKSDEAIRYFSAKLADAPVPWWTGAQRHEPIRHTFEVPGVHMPAATDKAVFLAAHIVLLSLLTGSSDVVTSVVTNCRPETDGAEHALGLFLNSLPMRINRAETWEDLVADVERTLLADSAHKLCPVADIQAGTGLDLSGSLFTFVHFRQAVDVLGDDSVDTTNYLLATEVAKTGTTYRVDLVLDSGAFDAAFAERAAGLYRRILTTIGGPISNAAILGETAQPWNDTAREFPADRVMHSFFEQQAARTPDAVALVFEGRTMSYRELNERANRLAHHLIGLGAPTLVGLSAERSFEMVIGIYGIWKAGAAYVPIDPSHPPARQEQIIEQAGIRHVLTHADLAMDYQTSLDNPGRSGDRAYVIFTSGSTGTPKGVAVSHRALINRIVWMDTEFPLSDVDTVVQKTPFGFDVSVWEFTWPLAVGARLVIARPDGHRDPDYLVDLIRTQGVTTLHFVPSMLRAMLQHGRWAECGSVRQVFCSGEALPHSLAADFFASGTDAALVNLYGPTEAAIDVSYWRCDPADEAVPIGYPIHNTRLHVLSDDRQPLPVGVPGELYIGGTGLADGYLGRPDLTAERFVTVDGERLYRTGDLVRRRTDGALEFLGRLDHQVKIRGVRIELGEIEAVLAGHPDVADVVVIARAERLVAYVVAPAGTDLRSYLASRLPDYLVPAAFVTLPALPLSANGKIDRKALPDPERAATAVAPRDTLEARVCEIAGSVLGGIEVGVHDPFFEVGGDSLKLIRLAGAIKQHLGVALPVMTLFEASTVARMAELIRGTDNTEQVVHRLTPPRPDATVTVLCVPYAAGDGVIYKELADRVASDIALFSVTNPRTFDADDPTQVAAFVDRCAEEIQREITGPVIVWGHCVGYALALVLAKRLPDVRAVCLGGVVIDADHAERDLSFTDVDVVDVLTTAGLSEVQGSITGEEWAEVAAKFRHDTVLSVRCDRDFFAGEPLPVPVYCVVADDDPLTPDWRENAANWASVSGDLRVVALDDGGHYFVTTRSVAVAALLAEITSETVL